VFNSVDEVDLADWERVCSASGASIFLDPRFMAAVEASMKPNCRFWYVILYDADGQPVACAGLSAMTVDITDFAPPRVAWAINRASWLLSRFRRLRILFCSLPGTPGDKSLVLSPAASSREALSSLDRLLRKLAADAAADAIIYKEFAPADLEGLSPLLRLGYRRIEIPPMHLLPPAFEDFAQYCAALRKRYRQRIKNSTRKLTDTGIAQSVLTDPDEILRLYTPEVHNLYRQVVAKSDLRLEVFPIEYYQQLTKRLNGQIELIALIRDSKILAFGWCLHDKTTYHMMYGGFDYELNHQYDLYFNMVYGCIDRALRKRVTTINVGQTATEFKARMGCYSEPRYVFAKGVGAVMSRLFHYGSGLLVISKPSNPPSRIFTRGDGRSPSASPQSIAEDA
jgi:predicted N-acyltransferase